jgi:outer membrane protein assembly factor BamE
LSPIQKIIPLIALLAGCQYVPMLPGLSPYKIDIQQGNYVTQDMLAKVKPGMSKAQVRFALGTPLVVDQFHNDRWDYVYELKKRGRIVEHRRLVITFADDKLVRIDGDVAPAAPGTAANAGAALTGGDATAPAATAPAPAAPAAATETPIAPAPVISGTPLEPGAAGTAAGDKPSPK